VKWPGRFEWKILGVVLLVAGLSVGTAAYALSYALRGFLESSRQGGADVIVERAQALLRGYYAERKEEFRRRAELLARTPPAHLAELEGTEDLMGARLLQNDKVVDEWRAPAQLWQRLHEAPPVTIALAPSADPAGESPAQKLELTFGIPVAMYDRFGDLTMSVDREQQRGRAFEALGPVFLRQYVVFVIGLLIVVPFVGLYFARRATRRVARLSEAARQVGEGDLTVRIAPTGRDELDELARAFDGMVEELSDARSRLEYMQKVSAWQEVARRLAHEIKNPLTPIQLSIQELVTKYRGEDPAYQRLLNTAAEISREEITALRRLVDDFSAFAKLPKVETAPLDLGGYLSDFARRHPEWQSCLEVEEPAAPVTARLDRILFGRVLANLVENAVQAAEGQGINPRVRLSIAAGGRPTGTSSVAGTISFLRLSRESLSTDLRPGRRRTAILIDDNGPGVSSDDRTRIFDPYVTSKPQGTGLGLAIVRKILLDHGGDVMVASSPSPLGGARFVVELPSEPGEPSVQSGVPGMDQTG
jgi:two-component system nitrogen regulation sensor histidine kinase NtrY